MKLLPLVALCLLLGCSSPRYMYRFPATQGATETGQAPVTKVGEPAAHPGAATPKEPPVVYSADVAPPVPSSRNKIRRADEKPEAPMAIGIGLRADPPRSQTPPAEGHLNGDLRRAIIFAAFGVVALLIGGNFLVVTGSLSLLIGLIFGIKWFIRR